MYSLFIKTNLRTKLRTCIGSYRLDINRASKYPGSYTLFFYKQPHFRVEPRVAIKIPKMRFKVAMKLLIIFGIEAQGC